jgi:hypothetical protein
MLERGDDMTTVAAKTAIIAVVHHDDVASNLIRASDTRESRDQTLRRLRLPVPANFRPHDDASHSRAANFFAKQRVPVAVRRAHPARRFGMDGGGDGILASRQLAANSRARQEKQIGMRVRMISEQMAAR